MAVANSPKVAVGQAGGPTAVINASLAGFLEAAKAKCRLFGIVNALQGLVNDWIYEIDDHAYDKLLRYRRLPGAALGSGRWAMKEEDFFTAVNHLKSRDIHHLVLIGGNGTMYACKEMIRAARQIGYDLAVIGIPKTVDNDLMVTDHSPGFGSAARYVAASVRDIGEDLKAMRNFESVRIVETMGRNVGWLAAASLLLKESGEQPPHLVYVPERPLVLSDFLRDVERTVSEVGYALVVISEGLRDESGRLLSKLTLHKEMSHTVLGGASKFLAEQVSGRLNLPARAEMLGMNQRCSASMVSLTDRAEAEALGQAAASLMLQGETGRMVTLVREELPDGKFAYRTGNCPLDEVAGIERLLPEEAVNREGTALDPRFRAWLFSLTGTDLEPFPNWSFHPKALS